MGRGESHVRHLMETCIVRMYIVFLCLAGVGPGLSLTEQTGIFTGVAMAKATAMAKKG